MIPSFFYCTPGSSSGSNPLASAAFTKQWIKTTSWTANALVQSAK